MNRHYRKRVKQIFNFLQFVWKHNKLFVKRCHLVIQRADLFYILECKEYKSVTEDDIYSESLCSLDDSLWNSGVFISLKKL